MSDFSVWYYNIPFFTRWWLSLTIAFSLGGRFGLLKAHSMLLFYEPFINDFQIWRPFTAVFFYPIGPSTGFHFLINCYFIYSYSMRLESGDFALRSGDYCYMLLINWLTCVCAALIIEMPLLMNCMVLSVLYVWCQLNKDTIVTFWFGARFKAMYLPWVLFAFNFILGGGGIPELVGIFSGHVYYFLKYTYPLESGGTDLLRTPQFILNWFPIDAMEMNFGSAPRPGNTSSAPTANPRGHNWGTGRVLGGLD